MPKKKAKKDKGKGKKDQKKGGLNNRERETFLLTIAELEHKIAWRNHLCEIIEEDIQQYQTEYEIQRKDKIESVTLLEEAIDEERRIFQNVQRAIPEAENWKRQTEANRAREMACKLKKIQEVKLEDHAELEELRKKLRSLESYNAEKVDLKLKDLEMQLQSEDAEDVFIKIADQEKRREEAFWKEMQAILADHADSMQAELSGQLDENFERITEETRWWADQANSLRITAERLESINATKALSLRASKKELKQRKEHLLHDNHRLQEREIIISNLLLKNKELEDEKNAKAELHSYLSHLDGKSASLKNDLDAQEANLMNSLIQIKYNEDEIKVLENKLLKEVSFGKKLASIIDKAQDIIMEEAKYSLILTYDGPPEEKKTVENLRLLFANATAFIYNRGNRSLI